MFALSDGYFNWPLHDNANALPSPTTLQRLQFLVPSIDSQTEDNLRRPASGKYIRMFQQHICSVNENLLKPNNTSMAYFAWNLLNARRNPSLKRWRPPTPSTTPPSAPPPPPHSRPPAGAVAVSLASAVNILIKQKTQPNSAAPT